MTVLVTHSAHSASLYRLMSYQTCTQCYSHRADSASLYRLLSCQTSTQCYSHRADSASLYSDVLSDLHTVLVTHSAHSASLYRPAVMSCCLIVNVCTFSHRILSPVLPCVPTFNNGYNQDSVSRRRELRRQTC